MSGRFDTILAAFVFGWPLLLCGVAIAAETISTIAQRRRNRVNNRPGFEIVRKEP